MEKKDVTFFEAVAPWLNELHGVAKEAISNLDTDDDWTFVIKIHALLEASLNMILIHNLGKKMTPFIVLLETGNIENGKLAWVKQLELMPKQHMDFIRILGPLRNKLAHNPKNLEFSFSEWITNLEDAKRKNFLKAVREIRNNPPSTRGNVAEIDKQALSNPKDAIWRCALLIMIHVDFAVDGTERVRSQRS